MAAQATVRIRGPSSVTAMVLEVGGEGAVGVTTVQSSAQDRASWPRA